VDNKNSGRISIIDSFRGIAALSVIFFHVFNRLGYNQVNFGLTGVDLFFMISGFVIFLSLSKSDSWKVFVAGRIARLYPVYWTCVTITAILIFLQTGAGNGLLKNYLFNLTMFQNYFKVPHLDFPYWTLIVEMQFYIFMLFLYRVSLLQKIEIPGMLMCLAVIIYGTVIRHYMPSFFHFINNAFPLMNHFPLFFAGIVFYKLKFSNDNRLLRWLLVAACFLLSFYIFNFNDRSNFLPTGYIYTIAVYFLLFTLFVVRENVLSFLQPFVFFGTISYSLYLIHQYFAFNILIPFLQRLITGDFLVAGICIGVLVVAAIIITYSVEKSSLHRFKSYLLKWLRYKRVQSPVLGKEAA
jgi:peptidoglycan/LPS O-acetylase OafA/YrhL